MTHKKDMPEEIWWDGDEYSAPTHAGDFDEGFTREFMKDTPRYVRADLPAASVQAGDVREAVEYLTNKRNVVWMDKSLRHLKTLIAAASRQPEVVTVDGFAQAIIDTHKRLLDRDAPANSYKQVMSAVIAEAEKDIRIVSKKEGA